LNYNGYCSPEVDKLIDRQSSEADQEMRKQLVWEIERELVEDGARPIIFYDRRATCWESSGEGADADGEQPLQRLADGRHLARQLEVLGTQQLHADVPTHHNGMQRVAPTSGRVSGCGGSSGCLRSRSLESVTMISPREFLRIDQKRIHYIHLIHPLTGKPRTKDRPPPAATVSGGSVL